MPYIEYSPPQTCPICGTHFSVTLSSSTTVGDYRLCELCIADSEVIAVIKTIEQEYAANPPSFLYRLFLSPIRSRIARAMRARLNNSIDRDISTEYRARFKKTKA